MTKTPKWQTFLIDNPGFVPEFVQAIKDGVPKDGDPSPVRHIEPDGPLYTVIANEDVTYEQWRAWEDRRRR